MCLTYKWSFASASAYYFTGANESWSEARGVLWGLTCQLWNTQTKPGSGAHQIGHAQQICMRAQAALLSGYCDVARRATAIPESQCSLITLHTHQIIMQITFQSLTMQTCLKCARVPTVCDVNCCHIKSDTGNSAHCEVIGCQILWAVVTAMQMSAFCRYRVNLTQSQERDCFF